MGQMEAMRSMFIFRTPSVIQLASLMAALAGFGISIPLPAQTMALLEKSNFEPAEPLPTTLDVPESELLRDELTYIGLLEATHHELSALYKSMRHGSADAGANIYKVRTFRTDTLESAFYCTWELYFGADSVAGFNRSLQMQNTAFVFASFDEGAEIKVNGIKYFLQPSTYFEHRLEAEKALKINHGGVTGITYMAKAKSDGTNVYLSTGKGTTGPMIGTGGIGLSFSTGSLQPVHETLAVFMLQVYRRSP